MAFLEFRIGNYNYELHDVTYCHSLDGVYFKSLSAKSKVFNLINIGNANHVVAKIFGDECEMNATSKMVFMEWVEEYSTATDCLAVAYVLKYLNNKE